MKRWALFPGDWTRDQVLLIIGPALLSVLLVVLYGLGVLPWDWPLLLIAVLLVNLAGDIAYGILNERRVRRSGAALCNDVLGRRVIAQRAFSGTGPPHEGTVWLCGERWRALSERPVSGGEPLRVNGRSGLVLRVDHDGSS